MKQLLVGLLVYALTISQVFGQAALLPNAKQTFVGPTGAPLAGGSVTFYTPNTTNLKTTWRDSGETTNNTNPVTLDSSGRAVVYGQGSYRQVVKDALGNVIWDATTTAYNSSAPSGANGTDTAPVGTIMPFSGFTVPTNWQIAGGQALSRTTYSQLLTAITISQTVSCTAGSPNISGWADTSIIRVGAPVEATCIPSGSTVASIVNSSTIALNNNAVSTGSVTATIFPWGNGDGSSTFNVPDLRGRTLAGADCMGGTCANVLQVEPTISTTGGSPTITVSSATGIGYGMTIISANVPANTTVLSVSGATVTMSANANATGSGTAATFTTLVGANAPGGSGGKSEFTLAQSSLPNASPTFSGTQQTVSLNSMSGQNVPFTSTAISNVAADNTGGTYAPGSASASWNYVSPTVTITPQGTISALGSGTPFPTLQPTLTSNYIIKVAPNTSGLGGVVSFGGMFGDIACDTTFLCAVNGGVNYAGLATQSDNTVLANTSGSTAQPTPQTPSAVLDHAFSSTQGSVLYRGATGWVALPPASAGYVLATQGSGADPTWAAPPTPSVNQNANTVLAGPSSGSPALPAYRALVSADIPSSVALSGTPTAPTPGSNISTTQIPTTAWVNTWYAPLASPALTGTPVAPTLSPCASTTQIATTAYVANCAAAGTEVYDTVADLVAANVPASVTSVQTLGYHTIGDGGAALYFRTATQPTLSCYQQSADGSYWDFPDRSIINVKWCGAYGDDGGANHDDETAVASAITALPSAGGTVFFPTGGYRCSATCINLLNRNSVAFEGPGVGHYAPTSYLVETGSSASLVRLDGTEGIRFNHLGFEFSNPAYAGNLIDIRQVSGTVVTTFTSFTDYVAKGQSSSLTGEAILFDVAQSINTSFDYGFIQNGFAGILGAQTGQFANGVYIRHTWFNTLLSYPIIAGGQNWNIEENTFEPPGTTTTNAIGIVIAPGGVETLNIDGNQFDDAGVVGTYIDFATNAGFGAPGPVKGFRIDGNFIQGGAYSININGASNGVISGNFLNPAAATQTILNGATAKNIAAFGNYPNTSSGPGAGTIFDALPTGNSLVDNNDGRGVIHTGDIGITKLSAASGTAPGAASGKLELVPGTNAGTCKLIIYAGTSATPSTILDNIGGGC